MITLLFVTNGHLLLVRGLMTTFDVIAFRGPAYKDLTELFVHETTVFFLAAIEIAAPLLAALFLSEVALGVVARAAPQMNVFMLGFPAKILLTLLLGGLALPLLPGAVDALGGHVLDGVSSALRAMSG
jgi:flagellar biosynthetic protein FliR